MTIKNSALLKTIALNAPGAGLVSVGFIGTLMGNHEVGVITEFGIGYIALLMSLRQGKIEYDKRMERHIDHTVKQAPVVRPAVGNIGALCNAGTAIDNIENPEEKKEAASFFSRVANIKELNFKEKKIFGIPRNRSAFATKNNLIVLAGTTSEIRDLPKASAARATLEDEAGRPVPLLKPVALRMSILLNQYPSHEEAEAVWDQTYHELRGQRLLAAAYRTSPKENLGAVIMDGPLGLAERGGTVLPYGDYRYIGFDKVEGIENLPDAHAMIRLIVEHGIYDADRKKPTILRPIEQKRLAEALYDISQKEKIIQNPSHSEELVSSR